MYNQKKFLTYRYTVKRNSRHNFENYEKVLRKLQAALRQTSQDLQKVNDSNGDQMLHYPTHYVSHGKISTCFKTRKLHLKGFFKEQSLETIT